MCAAAAVALRALRAARESASRSSAVSFASALGLSSLGTAIDLAPAAATVLDTEVAALALACAASERALSVRRMGLAESLGAGHPYAAIHGARLAVTFGGLTWGDCASREKRWTSDLKGVAIKLWQKWLKIHLEAM